MKFDQKIGSFSFLSFIPYTYKFRECFYRQINLINTNPNSRRTKVGTKVTNLQHMLSTTEKPLNKIQTKLLKFQKQNQTLID